MRRPDIGGTFESLAANLVRYLGDAQAWQPLARQADGRPLDVAAEPGVPQAQWRSLELAIRDLRETFGERYPRGAEFLERLETLKRRQAELGKQHGGSCPGRSRRRREAAEIVRQFEALKADALLANPLLDFERLLLVKRDAKQSGPAAQLAEQLQPAADRLRQSDRRPVAGPARTAS